MVQPSRRPLDGGLYINQLWAIVPFTLIPVKVSTPNFIRTTVTVNLVLSVSFSRSSAVLAAAIILDHFQVLRGCFPDDFLYEANLP